MSVKVIKIGGNVIDNPKLLNLFILKFVALEGKKILVHGGGKKATEISKKLGVEAKMIDGRRITDQDTLDVVTMVYGGLLNKSIVAKIQKHGTNALGLSGADLNLITSKKRTHPTIDYGYVGDPNAINIDALKQLLELDIVPVFCALTHDNNGQLLNTNADTLATEVSVALGPFFDTTLCLCFEERGVLEDPKNPNSVIPELSEHQFLKLKKEGAIYKGMIPKLENGFSALNRGLSHIKIGDISICDNQQNIYTKLVL